MRSHFDQALDEFDSEDPETRLMARRILEAERLRAELEPAFVPAKVKFSKRMASLPLPKRQRRKAEVAPVPNPVIRQVGIKGFLRSMAKGEAMERVFYEMTTQTNQLPPEPRPEEFPRFSLEMPATTGATILTETPVGLDFGRRGR